MRTFLIIILIVIHGCKNKGVQQRESAGKIGNSSLVTAEKKDFTQSVELLTNSKTIDDITYTINKISDKDVPRLIGSRFNDETNNYSGFSCFFLDIEIKNQPDITDYRSSLYNNLNEKVQYLSFMMKNYFVIKGNKREYYCINSTFERSYGQLPYSRFFLVFDKIVDTDLIFQYNDNYFNNGLINLKL